jgi:hypothetical protein
MHAQQTQKRENPRINRYITSPLKANVMTCLALRHFFARFPRILGRPPKCVPVSFISFHFLVDTRNELLSARETIIIAFSHWTERTVHGPAVERDATGRRESGRRHGGLTTDSVAVGSAASSTAAAAPRRRNVGCMSEAGRCLRSRPEFRAQLEADVRVS